MIGIKACSDLLTSSLWPALCSAGGQSRWGHDAGHAEWIMAPVIQIAPSSGTCTVTYFAHGTTALCALHDACTATTSQSVLGVYTLRFEDCGNYAYDIVTA